MIITYTSIHDFPHFKTFKAYLPTSATIAEPREMDKQNETKSNDQDYNNDLLCKGRLETI